VLASSSSTPLLRIEVVLTSSKQPLVQTLVPLTHSRKSHRLHTPLSARAASFTQMSPLVRNSTSTAQPRRWGASSTVSCLPKLEHLCGFSNVVVWSERRAPCCRCLPSHYHSTSISWSRCRGVSDIGRLMLLHLGVGFWGGGCFVKTPILAAATYPSIHLLSLPFVGLFKAPLSVALLALVV